MVRPRDPMPDAMAAQSNAMLALLRAGAPSTELLLAKSLEDLLAIGERLGIEMPYVPEKMQDDPDIPSPPPQADVIEYDVRRFTPPPSALTGAAEKAALTRARSRRTARALALPLDQCSKPQGSAAVPESTRLRSTGRRAHRAGGGPIAAA